ncbi:UbiH/UbiF/VisC/COQ6 family ubiquinone biosynthesis hydroxylase [Pseudoteredinibacter isoporae]|uniref:2-octaprenylphenol hydroxylase n=1 Tax=Pseudoteredinibacter isoporae TaxID=570281 RepID=A0A7X0MU65_9GAMM|nr:2-octaprenylphenol hydroxylase [Pseudoteredinibacter isoporae]
MSDHSQQEFDIAVVGAGLVGSTAALALANAVPNLNIVLLDAAKACMALADHSTATSVDDFDPRVVALTRDSQTLLQEVGAWPLLEAKRLCPYTDMQVWDAEGTARIAFDSSDIQEHNLGHIVENKLLVSALSERLTGAENITLLNECRVSEIQWLDGQQELNLQHDSDKPVTHVRATLVLACDGALSPLRQMMQIATREWDYGHDAIVTTVETDKAHQGIARQRFISTGPLAYLPLSRGGEGDSADEHFCSIVWSCIPERAEELMALDDREFSKELAAALEFELGDVKAVAKRFRIPLRQRHAREYIKPGFALAGDAAHTIHPLAGQGVNLGLKDVAAFVEQVQYAVTRDVPVSHYSILRRYQRQRMADNLTMMATMEGFKRLFGSKNISLRWLRNEGMRSLDKVGVLKNKIVRQAMGL